MTLLINTAELYGKDKLQSKIAHEKKPRWDCGDPSHFRGNHKCPKRREPRDLQTEVKTFSKFENKKVAKIVTFNMVCRHDVSKISEPLVDDRAPYGFRTVVSRYKRLVSLEKEPCLDETNQSSQSHMLLRIWSIYSTEVERTQVRSALFLDLSY